MLATAVACCLGASVTTASAFTVSLDAGALRVAGDPATANALTINDEPGALVAIGDDRGALFAGSLPGSCGVVSPSRIECPVASITSAAVVGGAAADTLTSQSTLGAVVEDGAGGDDVLYAGAHEDSLLGGPGDSVALTGTLPASASLRLMVPGQVMLTTPTSAVTLGAAPPVRARVLSVRRVKSVVRVVVSVPRGAGMPHLASLNANGRVRSVRRVTRTGTRIVTVRLRDPHHRTRTIRLNSAGMTSLSAVMC